MDIPFPNCVVENGSLFTRLSKIYCNDANQESFASCALLALEVILLNKFHQCADISAIKVTFLIRSP